MAQNVTINGQNYSAVPAVQIPKTGGGTAQFTDVSDTTAVAADVNSGKYIYLANGSKVQGSQNIYSITENLTQVSSNNSSSRILGGTSFVTELIPTEDYLISSVTVTMGGVDITSQVFSGESGSGGGGITPTGTINISQNGTVDVTNYASANVSVPNSYSSSDEGKVVSNGALVTQGSDTVTQNGTVDTTLISSLTVNVSGGGSNYVVDVNNVSSPSSTWSSFDISNTLSNGGYFEVEFYDPTPANDYGNIIGFGLRSALSSWSTNTAINFFHSWVSGTTDAIVIRQASTSSYANVDSSSPIKLKIDKDYIYVNNVAIVATASQIKNQTKVTFGSMQGSKRFAGTFNSIKAL